MSKAVINSYADLLIAISENAVGTVKIFVPEADDAYRAKILSDALKAGVFTRNAQIHFSPNDEANPLLKHEIPLLMENMKYAPVNFSFYMTSVSDELMNAFAEFIKNGEFKSGFNLCVSVDELAKLNYATQRNLIRAYLQSPAAEELHPNFTRRLRLLQNSSPANSQVQTDLQSQLQHLSLLFNKVKTSLATIQAANEQLHTLSKSQP